MKISNGTTLELIISLFLIYSVIFIDNNMMWNVAAVSVGLITLIHCIYLLLKKRKINRKRQQSDNWKELIESNYQSKGTKSYFKDMRLEKSENDYKNTDGTIAKKNYLKPKAKKILMILLVIIILLFSITSIFLINDSHVKKKDNIVNSGKNKNKEKLNKSDSCSFYPIEGTFNITISAESSDGVGDVFSKMDSNLEFRIHDSIYGDTYISKMKYQGDPTRYECDEVWYEIYLQNGKHGFVWAGYNGMYVKEQ